jgi:hypothetical protein
MFCCIADDRKENKTDKCLGDMGGCHETIDRVDKIFGTYGNGDCDYHKNAGGSPRAHLWFLGVLIFGRLLRVEKIGVRTELKDKIEDV